MPNNRKLKVSKITGAEKAHPYSRKADQLRRAHNRETKMEKIKSEKNVERTRVVDRILWFKFAIPPPEEERTLNEDLAHELAQLYIARNDDEIKNLKEALRPERPKPSRLALLELLRSKDLQEYNVGMRIPDVIHAGNVKILQSWEGDYNSISLIKMMDIRKREESS